jgi:probable HAF family extracellular repeat protein
VIGVNSTADGSAFLGVLWRDGEFTNLSSLSGYDCSEPVRINDRDQIVGFAYSCETGVYAAFLWENGEMVDLNTLIPGDSGIDLQFGSWIDEDGVIAAQGVLTSGSNMGDNRAVLLIPNGQCDAEVQAARAAVLKNMSAARSSANATGAALMKGGALLRGPDGRVNPMFLKPVSPAVLQSEFQDQSH